MSGGHAGRHPETGKRNGGWFLSFDCATKSFAFALLRVDEALAREGLSPKAAALAAWLRGDKSSPPPEGGGEELDVATRGAFHLAGGGAAALVPGTPAAKIPTVERVRAVQAYIRGPVREALTAAAAEGCPPPDSRRLHVLIEYQLGSNSRARTVSSVLLSEYSAASICLVGPALKNKVSFRARPDLAHARFIQKYTTLYAANKNHTKATYFEFLAPLFDHKDLKIPARLKTDFSDCVMQVLGLLGWGDIQAAATRF